MTDVDIGRNLSDENKVLRLEFEELKSTFQISDDTIKALHSKLNTSELPIITNIKTNDKSCNQYTAFVT